MCLQSVKSLANCVLCDKAKQYLQLQNKYLKIKQQLDPGLENPEPAQIKEPVNLLGAGLLTPIHPDSNLQSPPTAECLLSAIQTTQLMPFGTNHENFE